MCLSAYALKQRDSTGSTVMIFLGNLVAKSKAEAVLATAGCGEAAELGEFGGTGVQDSWLRTPLQHQQAQTGMYGLLIPPAFYEASAIRIGS